MDPSSVNVENVAVVKMVEIAGSRSEDDEFIWQWFLLMSFVSVINILVYFV